MTDCPAENTLAELARGALADEAAHAVERHLDVCPACAELVGVLAKLLHQPDSQLSTSPAEKRAASFLPRGTRVGRFVVDTFLGTGGMGVVYRAVDPKLDRAVALKLLRTELSGEEARARLLREAQAMARLSHPNVMVVYEVGTFRGQTFVAMELVDGMTLRDWLRAEKRPWRAVLDMFVQAGRGLAAAHAAGIVHRDFKPANVLLARNGRVRVMDFGLARAGSEPVAVAAPSLSPSSLVGEITQSGALVGTPAYMAPEQRGGRRADERSDQYSFCVSLHEGLHGHRPGEVASGGDVPAWLRRVLDRGLAREPSARYASMEQLLAALARPPRRWWLGGAAAALLLGAAAAPAFLARPEACPSDVGLAGVWDATRREALHRKFLATGSPQAEAGFQAAAQGLDAYARTWTQRRTAICASLRAGASDRRLACLEQRRRDLDAVVGQAMAIQALNVGRASLLTNAIPRLDQCDRMTGPVEGAGSLQQPLEVARTQWVLAGVLENLGRTGEAMAGYRQVLETARRLRYPPLEANVLKDIGTLQVTIGEATEARQTFLAAVAAAEEAGDELAKAVVWTRLAHMVGYEQGRPAEGHQFCRYAEAALARAEALRGPRPIERGNLAQTEASIYMRELDYANAGRLFEVAVAAADAIGEASPGVAGVYQNYGVYLAQQHRLDEADKMYAKALATYTDSVSELYPDVAMVWNNIADLKSQQGDLDGAFAAVKKSVSLRERVLAPDSLPLALSYYNLAEVSIQRGDPAAAAPYLDRAIAIIRKRQGDKSLYLGYAYTTLGQRQLATGKAADAAATLEQALAIREANPTPPELVAATRLALAQALWTAHRDPRAHALAERAARGFAEGKDDKGANEARAWLRAHGK